MKRRLSLSLAGQKRHKPDSGDASSVAVATNCSAEDVTVVPEDEANAASEENEEGNAMDEDGVVGEEMDSSRILVSVLSLMWPETLMKRIRGQLV